LINACAESLPRVTADAHQLEQVLVSLLMNATEAIGESYGQITIESRLVQIDEEFARTEVNAEILPGRYVVIEISDTGPGISPEVLPQIFDPFFTTKFMGRGLGLAAARGIIRGHHGAISVRSSLGLGTTFWVYLPAAEKAEPRSYRKASAPLRARGKTILVVDDEQIVLSVCRSALEMNGFEVLAAHSGGEAVDVLKRRAADVSAVILDVTMPQLSGEDTLPLLLNVREDLPVIVSSGYTRAQAMRAFSGHPNVAGFLQKPYTPAMLLQIVQPLFDQGALP
jgi:CheY-like chemotaxis protein